MKRYSYKLNSLFWFAMVVLCTIVVSTPSAWAGVATIRVVLEDRVATVP
jgi:hypothetical protein